MAAPYGTYPPAPGEPGPLPPRPVAAVSAALPAAPSNGHAHLGGGDVDADADGESDDGTESGSDQREADEPEEEDDDAAYSEPEQSASPPVVPHGHAGKKRGGKLSFPDELDADLYGLRRSVSCPCTALAELALACARLRARTTTRVWG